MVSPRRKQQAEVEHHHSRWSVSASRNLFFSRFVEHNYNPAHHGDKSNNGHYKYLQSIAFFLAVLAAPANAETIGGVSATAAPTATSSGSVTNMATMIAPSSNFSNDFGNGIRCSGPQLIVTPYVNRSKSWQLPFESYYDDPVYDLSDRDDNGILDNPGSVLYEMPTRTNQRDSHNWSGGLSMQVTIPLDGGLQARCKAMADANIKLHQQNVETRRLEYEIARLKNCGELKLKGIEFHPKSPYFAVCADVVIKPKPGQVLQHKHAIPSALPVELSGAPTPIKVVPFSQKP
nr:gp165 [uncultured Mediterranean phage uvMED]